VEIEIIGKEVVEIEVIEEIEKEVIEIIIIEILIEKEVEIVNMPNTTQIREEMTTTNIKKE
jgi:hypothetical protein